jgi:hypothetical protein
VIRLASSLPVDSFAEVMARARTVNGDDTIIDFGNGNTLLIENVRADRLEPNDFAFM